MPVQTFLPYSRKRGLFGHVVAQTREAWQTMELYPTQISEVHQTYPGHGKSIWACRECLGHPICKKKSAKMWIFGWVIAGILQIDYNWLQMQTTWTWEIYIWACRECLGHPICRNKRERMWIFGRVIAGMSFWTTNLTTIDYRYKQVDWPQIDY